MICPNPVEPAPRAPLVAICIGHSRRLANGSPEGGARSVDGTSEWEYCQGLGVLVSAQLMAAHGIASVVIDDYGIGGYSAAMSRLRERLQKTYRIRLAVELHFNAGPETATGHEWLYWHESRKGKETAQALDRTMRAALPELKARGIKARSSGDRGAGFLKMTPCPAVIAEPFFGTNPGDWRLAHDKYERMAAAIAVGIAAAMA